MTDMTQVPCKACAHVIRTRVRRNTVRCPSCRTPNYIPGDTSGGARTTQRSGDPDTAAEWEPAPIEAAAPVDADEDCPDCGTPLVWTPGGTLLWCATCEAPVFPACLVPVDDATDVRRVSTQAERDLTAIALAQRKGVVLAGLDELADDDRLDPVSLPVVEWFQEAVKAAESDGRLDELAELLPQAGIKRRHWWQGAPAVEAAGYGDDSEQDDGDHAPATLAIAAPTVEAPAVDHAAELAMRGYHIDYDRPQGECQLRCLNRHGGDPGPWPCGGAARTVYGPVRVCTGHYRALTTPLL